MRRRTTPAPARRALVTLVALAATLAAACSRRDASNAGDTGDTGAGAGGPCDFDPPPVLTAGGVGPVRVGQPLADSLESCAHDTTWTAEGLTETAQVVRVGDGSVIALIAAGGSSAAPGENIARIIVEDEQFRTERGVGVGSTVGDLRQQHGRICATLGEDEVVVASASMPGISFATTVDPRAIPGGAAALSRDPGLVPDSARIERLWVYDGDSLCGGS